MTTGSGDPLSKGRWMNLPKLYPDAAIVSPAGTAGRRLLPLDGDGHRIDEAHGDRRSLAQLGGVTTAGHNCGGAGASTGRSANDGAFAAAKNRTEDCAANGAAADLAVLSPVGEDPSRISGSVLRLVRVPSASTSVWKRTPSLARPFILPPRSATVTEPIMRDPAGMATWLPTLTSRVTRASTTSSNLGGFGADGFLELQPDDRIGRDDELIELLPRLLGGESLRNSSVDRRRIDGHVLADDGWLTRRWRHGRGRRVGRRFG